MDRDLAERAENVSATNGSETRNEHLSLLYSAIIIVIATISMRSVNNMVVTTLPFLTKYDFSFSNVMVGVISATIFVSTFAVTSYLNPMLESGIRRKVFMISSGILPVTLFLFYISTPLLIWPVSIASGLSFGFVFPNVITSATLHRDHVVQMRLLAIYSLSLSLSLVVGPSLETWLLTFLSYKEVFLPFIALSAMGFAVSPFIRFPGIRREVRGRAALRNNGLISSMLALTIYNVPFAAMGSFAVIFAVERFSVSSSTAYSAFIYFFVVSFGVRLLMVIRPLKSLFLPLAFSAAITATSLILFSQTHSFYSFLIIMTVLGVPHGTVFPMASMLVARGTKPEERNVANSYFMAYNNVLFILIPVIFGYLSTRIGFGFGFMILSVSTATATILLFFRYRKNAALFRR